MPGSDKTVDSGAIYISNTEPEYKAYVPYLSGNPKQLINGEQALVFARDRDTLANGNYGRAAHQREVMTELMNKMLSLNSVFKYQSFLNDISSDFNSPTFFLSLITTILWQVLIISSISDEINITLIPSVANFKTNF